MYCVVAVVVYSVHSIPKYHSHISFLSSNYLDGDNSAKNIQVAWMMPPRDLFDFPEPRRQREQLTI